MDDILDELQKELSKLRTPELPVESEKDEQPVNDEQKYYWVLLEKANISGSDKTLNPVVVARTKEDALKSVNYLISRGYKVIAEGFDYQWDLPIYPLGIHFNISLL